MVNVSGRNEGGGREIGYWGRLLTHFIEKGVGNRGDEYSAKKCIVRGDEERLLIQPLYKKNIN